MQVMDDLTKGEVQQASDPAHGLGYDYAWFLAKRDASRLYMAVAGGPILATAENTSG